VSSPSQVAFSEHALDQLARRGLSERHIAETVLIDHARRRRNPGSAEWLITGHGLEVVYNWPRPRRPHHGPTSCLSGRGSLPVELVKPQSYYSPEGDLAYLRVRPSDRVRTERLEWGLRDYDVQTGELAGLEVWEASRVLPRALIDSLPQLGRSDVAISREDLAKSQPLCLKKRRRYFLSGGQ